MTNPELAKRIKKTTIHWSMGLAFSLGLLLAGSEGDWFPWANMVGLGIMGVFALAANRMEGQG